MRAFFHLHFLCDAFAAERAQALDPLLLPLVACMAEASEELQETFARGLFPDLASLQSRPAVTDNAVIHWINRPEHGWLEGDLFGDGSAYDVRCGAARAGWALVQVDANGLLVAAAYGPVPWDKAPQQTPRDGEDYAISVSAQLATNPQTLHSDCAGTVAVSAWPLARQTGPANERAHLWSRFRAAHPEAVVAKTLGHATWHDVDAGRCTVRQKKGNGHADRWAKAGAKIHRVDAARRSYMAGCGELQVAALRWVGEAHVLVQKRREQVCLAVAATALHTVSRTPLRRTAVTLSAPWREDAALPPSRAPWAGHAGGQQLCRLQVASHDIWLADVVVLRPMRRAAGTLAFCDKCGAYYYGRVCWLPRQCQPFPASQGQLSRINRRLFPALDKHKTGHTLERPRGATAAEVANLEDQLAACGATERTVPHLPPRRLGRKSTMGVASGGAPVAQECAMDTLLRLGKWMGLRCMADLQPWQRRAEQRRSRHHNHEESAAAMPSDSGEDSDNSQQAR